MKKGIIYLAVMLFVLFSGSALADIKVVGPTLGGNSWGQVFGESAIGTDLMTFQIESGLQYTFENLVISGWTVELLDANKTIRVSGSVIATPIEFEILFNGLPDDALTTPLIFDFKASGGTKPDSAKLTWNGIEWSGVGDIAPVPEPSLILLLGIGIGAATLPLWRKSK